MRRSIGTLALTATTTLALLAGPAHARTIKPARGHAKPVGEVTPEKLRAACRLGGDYLLRMQKPDGSFLYTYLPMTDRESRSVYNLPRHSGTTFSLFQLARATGDARYAKAGRRAIGWMVKQIRTGQEQKPKLAYTYFNGKAKIGAIALSILALTEGHAHTPDPEYLKHAQALARAIVVCQQPGGIFGLYYEPGTDLQFRNKKRESEYYPGEACLALARLYNVDRREAWLKAAVATANDISGPRIQRRLKLRRPVPLHDHWYLYALEHLYRANPIRAHLEYGRQIAKDIVDRQITRADAVHEDEIGGWARTPAPGVAPAATRLEGLCAAYRTLKLAKQPTDWLIEPIRRTSAFLLRIQFRRNNSGALKNPKRASGGFPRTVLRPDVRIDHVQHAISGMLAAADILEAHAAATTQTRGD